MVEQFCPGVTVLMIVQQNIFYLSIHYLLLFLLFQVVMCSAGLAKELVLYLKLYNHLYNLLKKPVTDYNDYVENVIFHWDLTTKKEYIEKTFIAIKKAYRLYYEEMAYQKFGKSICELTKDEIKFIKREEMSIYLGAGNKFVERLPPPPPKND